MGLHRALPGILGRKATIQPATDLDFANDSYIVNGSVESFATAVAFSRASQGTYFDAAGVIQTAAVDEARFNYDRLSGNLRGLLVEQGSTNELLDSADVTTANWIGKTNWTFTANTSLINGQTAYHCVNDGGGSNSVRQVLGTLTGAEETASAIIENDTATIFALGIRDTTIPAWVYRVDVDFSDLSAAIGGGSGYHRIIDLGTGPNGGRMVWLSVTGVGTVGNGRQIFVYPTGPATNTDAAIIHHVQHEEQPNASMPIVTGASPVTTASDLASVDVTGFDSSGGFTLFGSGFDPRPVAITGIATIGSTGFDGSIAHRSSVGIRDYSTKEGDLFSWFDLAAGAGVVYNSTQGSSQPITTPNNRQKLAMAMGSPNLANAVNGVLSETDPATDTPDVDIVRVGALDDDDRYFGGTIERIQLFDKRLSNSALEALTA